MSSADADSTVGAGSAGSTTAALSQGTATIGSSNRKGSTVLLNQPIVIDSGTATIKAGFAGGSKPKVVIGTKIGRPKHTRIMPGGALEADAGTAKAVGKTSSSLSPESGTMMDSIYVGRKLDEHRGAFRLSHPMEHGCVNSDDGEWPWEAMERLWEHVYSRGDDYGGGGLSARLDEHPVLFTEAPLNPEANRERIAEIFFETFRTPALFLASPAVLSLYAAGRTTGVAIDVGEGVSHAIPVYEGFALRHSIVRSDVAGRDVTNHLQLLVRRSGLALRTTAEVELAKRIKEEVCYVAFDPTKDERGETEGSAPVQYQLPDGQPISLGNERFRAPEVLFRPDLIGSEELSVADVLVNSVMKSDMDLRSTLFERVVLAGGSTLFPGFGDRFLYEVRQRAPGHTRIHISAPSNRIHSTWIGGSILASLATFKSMWVSRAEYEEYGNSILHRNTL